MTIRGSAFSSWCVPSRGEPARPWHQRLARALERRRELWAVTEAFRLLDEDADEVPGIAVDRYGHWAVLRVASPGALSESGALCDALLAFGARGVYLKARIGRTLERHAVVDPNPSDPLAGSAAPEVFPVREHGWRLNVSLADGQSTGLFVDQRDNRRRLFAEAGGARVLNLFCYTGSFTVAAAVGGAAATTSIDVSGKALRRLRENLALNGVEGAHSSIKEDVMAWLARAGRRNKTYDYIVFDPPSFGRSARGSFAVAKDYVGGLTASVGLLDSRGKLLAVTNHRGTTLAQLHGWVRDAADRAGVRVASVQDLPPPADCPGGGPGVTVTKSVLLTLS